MNKIKSYLFDFSKKLNESKYFFGLMMILLTIGSKYIIIDISENQQKVLSSKIMRRILIFTVVFIATRDVIVSFILTGLVIVIFLNLFHEKSYYCVLPNYLKFLDTNTDGKISEEELNNAINILKKSGKYKINNK